MVAYEIVGKILWQYFICFFSFNEIILRINFSVYLKKICFIFCFGSSKFNDKIKIEIEIWFQSALHILLYVLVCNFSTFANKACRPEHAQRQIFAYIFINKRIISIPMMVLIKQVAWLIYAERIIVSLNKVYWRIINHGQ